MITPDLSQRYTRHFFEQSTLAVAEELLGAILVHDTGAVITAGRIVETEGYCGPEDKAAHTYLGRLSQRNRAMFGPKGHAYVFQIYGMYWCMNVVSGAAHEPQAVLIRALQPIVGMDVMRQRVKAPDAAEHVLCRGPGKLCKAMGIDKSCYGQDLLGERLFLVPGKLAARESVQCSARVNIDYAEEYIELPWRYYIQGNPAVSGPARLRR